MPYSMLRKSCCCTTGCTSPYRVFVPCNGDLDVATMVMTKSQYDECGFNETSVYLYDSPFCSEEYCGKWVCNEDYGPDYDDWCIPSLCECGSDGLPRLWRPSDNPCDHYEELGDNDELEDGTCCDIRCPERINSCFDDDVTGACDPSFRTCECTTVNDLVWNLNVSWEQRSTTTEFFFDYVDTNGDFQFDYRMQGNVYVKLDFAQIVDLGQQDCTSPNSSRQDLQVICTWRVFVELPSPPDIDLAASGNCPDGLWLCSGGGGAVPTLQWEDTFQSSSTFQVGLNNNFAFFDRGGGTVPPPLNGNLVTAVGCPGRVRGDYEDAITGFTGNNQTINVSLNNCDNTAADGIQLCPDMQGTATWCRDIGGAVSFGATVCSQIGGQMGGADYGTVSFTAYLQTPPAPNQAGGC